MARVKDKEIAFLVEIIEVALDQGLSNLQEEKKRK
jgi:hypothetical protein